MATAIIGNQKHKLKATIVEQLPDKGVSNKIYYVPNKTKGNNKYDEYVWLKDTEHPNGYFEKVGQKDIDLEPYALKEYVNIQDKIITDKLTNSYYDKTQTDKKLDTKVDKVEDKELSSNDFTNDYKISLERLETNIKYLGHFKSHNSALNALMDISICKNRKLINIYLTYGVSADSPESNMIVIQNIVSRFVCIQIIFDEGSILKRTIRFKEKDSNEIDVIVIEPYGADGLKWDKELCKYIFKDNNHSHFNVTRFDSIPLANSITTGLMSAKDNQILQILNQYNFIGGLDNWDKVAKLTTESTEEDILNALVISDLNGNDTTSGGKDFLFDILGQCVDGGKLLQVNNNCTPVFINYLDYCYVIYTLGNKGSELNDGQVSTLVLRSITISDGSDDDTTLAVLKNPLEINLEDINKKVGDLEAQVKDLTNRIATLENK